MNERLTENICFFIDILGYEKILDEAKKNQIEQFEFERFFNVVNTQQNFLKELCEIFTADIKIFSDNLAISIPVDGNIVNNLYSIFSHSIDYQMTLINENYFIRGGVAKGNLYTSNNFIYGAALVEAVNLEKSATYPFISISSKIIEMLEQNNVISDIYNQLSLSFIKFNNEMYFLDYLFSALTVFDKETPVSFLFLQSHKSQIEHNLKKYSNIDEKVFSRYEFLANYHNQFCDYVKGKFLSCEWIKYYHVDSSLFSENKNTFKRVFLIANC